MILKKVGYYKELPYGDSTDPSIIDNIGAQIPNKDKICTYLQNGIMLAACAGVTRDAICPEKGIIGTPDSLSDGIWIWHADLSYYVKEYGLKLSEEFIEHMKLNSWLVPKDVNFDLDNIEVI